MKEKIDEIITSLTIGRRYLKGECKSNCAAKKGYENQDQCCPFVLSDPKESYSRRFASISKRRNVKIVSI